MSVTDPTPNAPDDREEPPEFDLVYRFDDADDPREVTVFPSREASDITTEWITAETTDTLPLTEIR